MAEEKTLIRQRASCKGRLTSFINYFNSLDVSSLAASEVSELRVRVGKLDSLYALYDEVQLKIECLLDDSESQLTDREDFESRFYKILARAQLALDELPHNGVGSSQKGLSRASSVGSLDSVIPKGVSGRNKKLVKLPTIQLPKFNGAYDMWLEFHDTFLSLIHANSDIDDINKFHYLRASLEGTAALVIQAVGFSAQNYQVAWELLCDRFDNKRLLIQNHVSALFNIETITRESSVILKRTIDELNKNLRALQTLGEPIKHWDTLLIHLVTQKLDSKTYRNWEEHRGRIARTDGVTFDMFVEFIRSQADLLETLEISRGSQSRLTVKSQMKTMVSVDASSTVNAASSTTCPHCNSAHGLSQCSQFLALSNNQRMHLLPSLKVCFNCFCPSHYADRCKKQGCSICRRKHNVLVHGADVVPKGKSVVLASTASALSDDAKCNSHSSTLASAEISPNIVLSASVADSKRNDQEVLLSTALIKLVDRDNREYIARAVLDSGSTSCLMTEQMHRRMNCATECVDRSVSGINNAASHVNKMCRLSIKSLTEDYSIKMQCFVLPSITDSVPCRMVDVSGLNIPSDISLADPNFHRPSAVDVIIGADLFWDLLGSQIIKLGDGKPTLCETRLGWIISGPIKGSHQSTSRQPIQCNFTKMNEVPIDDIQNQLTRFWQLEEVSAKSSYYTEEEKLCEEHFVNNTTRQEDGRFCVKIPLKQSPNVLGDSLQRARQCLLALERRNKNKPDFGKSYCEFMKEYRDIGHMSQCQSLSEKVPYFIPHHGVVRESSTTTKLRVVFNASSTTTSGLSYNNIQMVGPTIQDDIVSILIRFRQHKYVLIADVEKMYRQILVHPDDRHLQQILWRDSPSETIHAYELNTVTYGTASAPYLAIRCLKQVGLDCQEEKISEIIQHDFYVDDLISGGDDKNKVLQVRQKVTAALALACMPLRKWKSNDPDLMFESASTPVDFGDMQTSKTLGLGWIPSSDELCFPINVVPSGNTKRSMLSVVSQVFDPLGLLAPCVVSMKIMLQKLWLQGLSWDEQLPPEIAEIWAEIIRKLPVLNAVRIARHVICDSFEWIDLHIFTDASQLAYGACVYVRSSDRDGNILVRLFIAKSRVAPIKPTTIPRLELCGALVGVGLYEKVLNSLRAHVRHVTFWTDSMIVLGWLNMLPNKLQPFVRNRVADILEKANNCTWRHVPTDQNPADFISRGVDVNVMSSLGMWWNGPDFLREDRSKWPSNPGRIANLPEMKPEVSLHCSVGQVSLINFERFSNLSRLIRSVAYMLRFIDVCRKREQPTSFINNNELNRALNTLIKISQVESFPEYSILDAKQPLPKKSPLIKFSPFLDDNNLMRVGGRLENSNYSYNKKHPLLIQSTHRLTKLLFKFEHAKLMHAGPQLLLASIRESYWPIGGRNLAKACYRQCIRCSRMKGQIVAPLMGNLPQQRLTPGGYPFENVGVDYAGPLLSANRQGRGCRLVKVYIAVFICFATKAIHLELVGDLTSNSYLLALRRFISRRGKPFNIYSDNGTSFVGAYNDLSKFLKSNSKSLSNDAANDGVNFHFIPAYSPHFGGLWEAGVKSCKYHLQRVLGNCKLTYEELYTTLVQIEAILNSRPLTPLSADPEDLLPLTPGHFLVGRSMTSLPGPEYSDRNYDHLTRYQRVEQLRQHFWTRWSKEYISELQQKTKWRVNNNPLNLEMLVLLKEDNLSPLQWKLGRIVAVHPGSDGICRVADIRTTGGIVRRAFSKICPLPLQDG